MDPHTWELLGTDALHDCRVFELQRLRARSPRTGAEHAFFRLEASDWVNVLPLTPDGEVVMVRQYRHGAGEVTLEIPGGMVDAGEAPQAAAARELLEETGYEADTVELIGSTNPNPALFGNTLWTFLATNARHVAPVRNEGAEYTSVECVPLADVPGLMRDGVISHALVVVAFHWHALRNA